MIIKYKNLQDLDIVLTTDISFYSEIIRKRQGGKMFDASIATHVGLLIKIYGSFYMYEMIVRKGLIHNNFEDKYCSGRIFKPRVVDIMRNPVYEDVKIRNLTKERIMCEHHQNLKYDYAGILAYLFRNIKQMPTSDYCSELINRYAKEDGNPIVKNGKCRPYDIQTSPKLVKVDWNA